MVTLIMRRELAEHWRDGRLTWAGTAMALLLLISLAVGFQHRQEARAEQAAAQTAAYADWLEQGPRHPHDSAHQGMHAFRPEAALAIVDPGINPFIGSTVWLQAHRQSEVVFRPAQDASGLQRFGDLSVAWVLQVLVPRTGERIDHLTGGVTFELGSATTLDLSLDYLHDDNKGYFGTPLVPAGFATKPTDVVSTPDCRVIDERIARTNYNAPDNDNRSETYWLRRRVAHRVSPSWTVRNELAFNKADRMFENAESAVFQAPGYIVRDQTLITHDTQYVVDRLDAIHAGTLGGLENRFNIGIEAARSRFDNKRRLSDGSAATIAALRVSALDPMPGPYDESPALSTGAGNRTNQSTEVTNYSLFVEDAVRLTRRFTLVGGLRRERTEVSRAITDLNTGGFSSYATDYGSTSARLGAVHALSPNASIYAQASNATLPVSSLFLLRAQEGLARWQAAHRVGRAAQGRGVPVPQARDLATGQRPLPRGPGRGR